MSKNQLGKDSLHQSTFGQEKIITRKAEQQESSEGLTEQPSQKSLLRNMSKKSGVLIRNESQDMEIRENARLLSQTSFLNNKKTKKGLLSELEELGQQLKAVNDQFNKGGVSILFSQQEYIKHLEDRKFMKIIRERRLDSKYPSIL